MIDIRTILFSYVTTNLVCAAVMAFLWRQNRRRFAGIGYWLLNFVVICAGVVLLMFRGVAPDLLSIVLANGLVIYGVLLLLVGLEHFVGLPRSHSVNYALLAAFVLVHAIFTFLQPSLLARNINASVALFVYAIQIAWLVFRRLDRAAYPRMSVVGMIAVGLCLVSVARVIADQIVDPGNDFLQTGSDAIVILAYQILQISLALTLFLQVNGRLVTNLERDISDRKRAERSLHETQLRMLGQQRDMATLEERERLGRELHDGIGQVLGFVNVQTQAAQTLLGSLQLEAAQENLASVNKAVLEAHTDLRRFILGLRDSASPPRDLIRALAAYLSAFRQAWGIETVFSPPETGTIVLPVVVEDQLLHIVQEALINIRKHAGARRVEVLISIQGGQMVVVISDDGQGFDADTAPDANQKHFGLSIMRERAEQVGGQLEIRSAPGGGTRVIVHVPCEFKPASAPQPVDLRSLRILLVDDQPLFLDGMRNLLKARGLIVVGSARDGLEACEQVRCLRPDVVLMDVQMPRCGGIEATRRIRADFPETKIVLLTVSENDADLLEAIRLGASSYMLKSVDAETLFSTLDGLARGEIQIAPELAARLLREFNRTGDAVRAAASPGDIFPAELTARQWEVLRLIARGLTYKEAAREAHLSEPAIKYHMGQILERLQLKNREQAVHYLHRVEDARNRAAVSNSP